MTTETMKRLTHQSKHKEITVRPMEQTGIDFKPKGFWYSVDGDWERWCKEDSGWEFPYTHDVKLGGERILRLESVTDIDMFHDAYKGKVSAAEWYRENYIDWVAVARAYDGIEIAPYQWARRLDGAAHKWYYGWDCASGCIWRPNGVICKLIT